MEVMELLKNLTEEDMKSIFQPGAGPGVSKKDTVEEFKKLATEIPVLRKCMELEAKGYVEHDVMLIMVHRYLANFMILLYKIDQQAKIDKIINS